METTFPQYSADRALPPAVIKVKAAAISNLTLSGEQTVDGVSLVAGDRVFTPLQTTTPHRRAWIVGAEAWEPAPDMPTGSGCAGLQIRVQRGTVNIGAVFACTNAPGSDVAGTHTLVYIGGAKAAQTALTLTVTGDLSATPTRAELITRLNLAETRINEITAALLAHGIIRA